MRRNGMAEEQSVRDQILIKAQEEFFAHGFSRVTTDELASALGISKKTLYQHFSSKEEIVREASLRVRDDISATVAAIVDDPETDFVEKLRGVMTVIGSKVSRMRRPFFEDMQKKAPELWKEMEEFRREKIFTVIGGLIRQGGRRGMLRKDVNPDLFVLMFLTLVQNMINPEVLSQLPFSAAEVFRTFITVMLEGILTDEARDRYFQEA
jgi:AcrR family transcriptional regulator